MGSSTEMKLYMQKDLQQLGMLIKAAAVCADVSTAQACPYSATYLTVTQSIDTIHMVSLCTEA